jgi:hypothetical protein
VAGRKKTRAPDWTAEQQDRIREIIVMAYYAGMTARPKKSKRRSSRTRV